MKEALAMLFQALFSKVTDAKSLALNSLTMFIALLFYLVVMNQGDLIQFARTFSRSTVIEQVQGERVSQYPKVAKERATMLLTQSRADEVVVAEYRPRFVNNYQDLVAWEGMLSVDPTKVLNSVLNKSSGMYSLHIQGKDYGHTFDKNGLVDGSKFVTSGAEYTNFGASYVYTCPIFDLDNSYSGYVGIVYKEIPFINEVEEAQVEEYLERLCAPHARALGRKK